MALQVIGAGFGRTGTLSLKMALETLGFGPCYHMVEVIQHPEHAPVWQQATRGNPVDWDALLDGYRSGVDWPLCAFWSPLAERYADAKVILSERDPKTWFKSASETIFQLLDTAPDGNSAQGSMARELILERTFDGRHLDEAHAIAVYKAHRQAVIEGLPADRLLRFRAADGWAPLCNFLGVPVPDSPYPRVNSTDEFTRTIGASRPTSSSEP
ncbi:MAG: sulfotransferase [Pseudomonadota bacterium]|nr:sulfotransferase [Pseudomonadota bacterium]